MIGDGSYRVKAARRYYMTPAEMHEHIRCERVYLTGKRVRSTPAKERYWITVQLEHPDEVENDPVVV